MIHRFLEWMSRLPESHAFIFLFGFIIAATALQFLLSRLP
jgi:hypothetical protein